MGELLNDLVDPCLNFQHGFYIEAGANNGIRQSNTIFLEKTLNWKGILIEPNSKKMEICKQVRSKTNVFYNCALVRDENVKEVIGNFDEDHDGESLVASVSDVLDYYEDSFKKGLLEKINSRKQISVPAKTINSILEENNINKVDFFSLDLEGYEYEVLRGINYDKFKIDYILVETSNRSNYKQMVHDLLANNGYCYYKQISTNDDLYKRLR